MHVLMHTIFMCNSPFSLIWPHCNYISKSPHLLDLWPTESPGPIWPHCNYTPQGSILPSKSPLALPPCRSRGAGFGVPGLFARSQSWKHKLGDLSLIAIGERWSSSKKEMHGKFWRDRIKQMTQANHPKNVQFYTETLYKYIYSQKNLNNSKKMKKNK